MNRFALQPPNVLEQQLQRAMMKGIERAGFVNARAGITRIMDYEHIIEIVVRGDCPCGLGTSQFMRSFYRADFKRIGGDVIGVLEEWAYHTGLKHIEQDKIEGRWAR